MAITPKDIITFRELWKKIALAAGQQNPTEFPFDLFITTSPLVDVFTFYVDPTLGNDANRGDDSLAPKRTIASALASIPKTVSQPYTINLAAGTYAEQVVLEGYSFLGGGGITFGGTTIAVTPTTGNSTGTVTSYTTATAGVQPFIIDSGQNLTSGELKGKLIKATSGGSSGTHWVIYDNDATHIYVVGLASGLGAGITYAIVDHGTIIKPTLAGDGLFANGLLQIRNCSVWYPTPTVIDLSGYANGFGFKYLQVEAAGTSSTYCLKMLNASAGFLVCSFKQKAGLQAVHAISCPSISFNKCYFNGTGTSSVISTQYTPYIICGGCYIYGKSGSSNSGLAYFDTTAALNLNGTVIEKNDIAGRLINLENVAGFQAQSFGLFLYGKAGSVATLGMNIGTVQTAGVLSTSTGSAATLTVTNCTTGVQVNTGSVFDMNTVRFDTVGTGVSVVKGGYVHAPGTVTFITVPTNEILLDGTAYTFTGDLDSATPKVLFNNYGSRIAR